MSRETANHVRYIDKTRAYYEAEGYAKPYEWAHFDHIPFTPFASVGRPLSECRVGVVTTSEMARRGVEAGPDDPRRLVYALPSDIPVDELCSRKAAYDRYATTLDDVDSYLPLTHLHRFVAEGKIGAVAPRFQMIQSEYSHRKTLTVDAPEILKQMREDRVDVAVLTAVWPVCHQTVSLAARYLEENGIPTVLFGCARDIVEHCGVPRFVFSDFPLGNPTGKPYDLDMQREVLSLGLDLLVNATAAGTTVVTPYEWSADDSWKDKVLTKAQPFLDPESTRKWLERKETYRALKAAGKI